MAQLPHTKAQRMVGFPCAGSFGKEIEGEAGMKKDDMIMKMGIVHILDSVVGMTVL